MPISDLTPELLAAALQGLEAQRARLDAQIAEVRRMLGTRRRPGRPAAEAAAPTPKPKRKLSAAGRRRIADAARKRWAAFHRQQAAVKPKRTAMVKKAAPKKATRKTAGKTAAKGPKKVMVKVTKPAAEGAGE